MADGVTKERAHELIERLEPGKLSLVVDVLEKMVDPVAHSLANAPFEDEEICEDENRVASRGPRLRPVRELRWRI